jgi:hypothetical protein
LTCQSCTVSYFRFLGQNYSHYGKDFCAKNIMA